MLTEQENETLTLVGPGTPMGDLLRRYWHPIAAAQELEETPTKPLRLLGEDLVLYKDLGGNYGLLQRGCAHRFSDLAMGLVEDYGLRCYRHGWLYGPDGQCLDMPMEPEPFCAEIKINAYAVEVKAGVVWAYMGPQPAPLLPDWEPLSWDDALVQIVFAELPCNWLQCQENSLDAMDTEWLQTILMHPGEVEPPPRDLQVGFDEFEYGFVYRRALPAPEDQEPAWAVGRTSIWPNGLFVGDQRSCRFEWRVPLDDKHTLNLVYFIDRLAPGAKLPGEQRVFHWTAPIQDDKGEMITSHALNRSFTMWVHQGEVFDRTREHLVASDEGIMMLRTKYFSQIALIADGGEPKATLREASQNQRLRLPESTPSLAVPDIRVATRPADPKAEPSFTQLAGQPEDVAAVYRQVIQSWDPQGDSV